MSRSAWIAGAILLTIAAGFVAVGAVAWRALSDLPERRAIQSASAEAVRAASIVEEEERLAAAAAEDGALAEDAALAAEPQRRVRFVDEGGVVSIRPEGPLLRAPAATIAPEEDEPEEPAGPEPDVFRLVVIESAGLIDAREQRIALADVEAPAADERCTNAQGREWPCGMRARTALRRLVRRRAIECVPLDPDAPSPQEGAVVARRCAVAGTDLSQWLVEQGWAVPADSAPPAWTDVHEAARAAGLGRYDPDGR